MDTEPLLENIEEADLAFEFQLLENPRDETIWNNYINHKKLKAESASIEDKIKIEEQLLSLLYRQSWRFEESYEIWSNFVDYYTDFVGRFSFNPKELNKIDGLYRSNISKWKMEQRFWIKWIEFVLKYTNKIDINQILSLVNSSFINLKHEDHIPIWEIVFKVVLKLDNVKDSMKFDIFFSYMIYQKNSMNFGVNETSLQENEILPSIDETMTKLLDAMNEDSELTRFSALFNELIAPKFLLRFSTSELDLFSKYFERLIQLSESRQKQLKSVDTLHGYILRKFGDQQSLFTIKYGRLLMTLGEFDEGLELLEDHMKSSVTIKDFTLIFDSITERLEKKIEELSESADGEEEVLIKYVEKLEYLLQKREFLMNDVKLEQNKDSPLTWIERLDLYKKDESQVPELLHCYSNAVLTIKTNKIPSDERQLFPQIWCDYAKFYYKHEESSNGGALFEAATKVPWTTIEQLETIWIEWIKCEIETGNIYQAVHVASMAVAIPKQVSSGKIDVNDESTSVHMKVFRSLKLWSLYLDLVENLESFDSVCQKYDDAIDLKVVNGVVMINYCKYLEENGYFEKGFSVFERGLAMFGGNSKDILFIIYLDKVLKYWSKLNWDKERVREIFEKGIDHFTRRRDSERLRDIYILYANWEMEFGSQLRSLRVLEEGISKSVKQADKLTLYKILAINTIESKGLHWAIEVFSTALEEISVQVPGFIESIVDGFVRVEIALNEPNKAREVLRYAAENIMEFNKSTEIRSLIWEMFKSFELKHGDEVTFKDMLRRKHYLENMFGPSIGADNDNTASRVATELKDKVGFVKSSTGPKTTTYTAGSTATADPTNGSEKKVSDKSDEIALEMDLSDDE